MRNLDLQLNRQDLAGNVDGGFLHGPDRNHINGLGPVPEPMLRPPWQVSGWLNPSAIRVRQQFTARRITVSEGDGSYVAIGKRTVTLVPLLISLAIFNSPPWA